ncbi:MAG: hypothetical protein KBD15_01555 [Candidatus Magasanikbacteria bacterium]|nr:hypothetical protein [Candidatus Magasanikbacteria bacterium]
MNSAPVKRGKLFVHISLSVSLVSLLLSPFQSVNAAALTLMSNTMSSSKINEASSHVIRFTTPTGASDNTDTIVITFPADFDFTGKNINTLTFTHGGAAGEDNTETLAANATGVAWGAAFSGVEDRVLTLTAPTDGVGAAALAGGSKAVISYTSASTVNPSVADSYSVTVAGDFGDTGTITVNILDNDQVSVSATVSQSFTFSISDNTIGFGTLSSSNDRFATGDLSGADDATVAHTLVVGTNAANGYTMTLNGATLTSGGNTIDAIGAANTASDDGTEQFGLRIDEAGGSGAVTAPYADAGYAFDSAAFPDQVASSGTASANTTYSVIYLANITANTEAGAYTATMTYTATANF